LLLPTVAFMSIVKVCNWKVKMWGYSSRLDKTLCPWVNSSWVEVCTLLMKALDHSKRPEPLAHDTAPNAKHSKVQFW
jgi:hypothetical protein